MAKNKTNGITVYDRNRAYFSTLDIMQLDNVLFVESELTVDTDYLELMKNQDVVYHLISTTVPTTSNQHTSEEFKEKVILSSNLFDACVRQNIKEDSIHFFWWNCLWQSNILFIT